MVNDTNNSKLDQAVKQTLTNYEAPYNASDWAKMESMLDAAPQSTNFKWSYPLNILIGVLVLVGIYVAYNSISSAKKSETNDTKAEQPLEGPVNKTPVTAKPSAVPVPSVPAPASTENTPPPENKVIPPLATTPIPKDQPAAVKEPVVIENKTGNTAGKNEKNTGKPQRILKMGNEPIFGDMLDSSKGIVGKTKEKEETKKAVKAQPDNSIGWKSFLLKTNLDSLKKYHEQQQKDSLKK